MRAWQTRILVGLGSVVAVLAVGGAIFEAIMRQQIAQQYPAPGKLVDIGGRRIQLDCRGSGSPTVVLESGLDPYGSLSWAAVQDSIAQTTRVCAYSRAGIMWSDPAPGEADSRRTVQDLHTALTNAGEQAPWVMVGHSLGGPHIMRFTEIYDKEVVGFIFVDASHPDQVERYRKVMGKFADDVPIVLKTPPILAAAVAKIGIVRLFFSGPAPAKAPPIVGQIGSAYFPQTVSPNLKAVQASDTTIASAGHFRQLGNRPLVVLTAIWKPTPDEIKASGLSGEQVIQVQSLWKELQADEATWSSHSRHEIVDSSHNIQFDRPDVVIHAINEVVVGVRKP